MTIKTCSHCGEARNLEEFVKNKSMVTGYGGQCKICHSLIMKGVSQRKRLRIHIMEKKVEHYEATYGRLPLTQIEQWEEAYAESTA